MEHPGSPGELINLLGVMIGLHLAGSIRSPIVLATTVLLAALASARLAECALFDDAHRLVRSGEAVIGTGSWEAAAYPKWPLSGQFSSRLHVHAVALVSVKTSVSSVKEK
jgi:hypothetical protein